MDDVNDLRTPSEASAEREEQDMPYRELDIPVESWDAYKSWCDRIRDTWNDDMADQAD